MSGINMLQKKQEIIECLIKFLEIGNFIDVIRNNKKPIQTRIVYISRESKYLEVNDWLQRIWRCNFRDLELLEMTLVIPEHKLIHVEEYEFAGNN